MIPLCEPVLYGSELQYVTDCVNSGWISSSGDYVRRFENALADYLDVGFVVACNSGTSAIHISLVLAGVAAGEEVIVPTVTFVAPVNAVRYVNAFPVFVDCDQYCNMDVEAVRRFLAEECLRRGGATINKTSGRKVSAIIPVHVFGTSVDMDAILATAQEYNLAVIEDASESLGSLYKGKKCGGLAPLGCLSFNGNKIVTTGGGGAILTDDEETAAMARYLTTQAKDEGIEYVHRAVGYNYRMNNVLASLGLAQLETIEDRLACKRRNFDSYERTLGRDRLIQQPPWSESNRWFYGLLCLDQAEKERLLRAFLSADIQVRPLWRPIHLLEPYRDMQSFRISNAVRLYERLINIPCSVNLTEEQIDRVVSVIRGVVVPQ